MIASDRHDLIRARSSLFGTHRLPARIDDYIIAQGPERGTRVLRLVNGGGLDIELHPDRALDVGHVTLDGIPFAWISPTGFAAPGLAERADHGWLRTFGGGLVSTCGMDTFGDPSVTEDGTAQPQHGRFGTQPARIVRADIVDEHIIVEADIVQAAVHGEYFHVRRRIDTRIGSQSMNLTDDVTNRSDREQPHMVLYHANLGWPVLGPSTVLTNDATTVEAENDEAVADGRDWSELTDPTADAGSLVYRHHLPTDSWACTRADNPETGVALTISTNTRTLPYLHSWKVMRPAQYVMGIEPANSPTMSGAADADANGTRPALDSGETRRYELRFAFETASATLK